MVQIFLSQAASLLSAVGSAAAIFYQSLKVKYKAADSVSNMFQMQDTASSPYIRLYYLSVMLIISFTLKRTFNFVYQSQEEAGSTEEQPASNKADTYTVIKSSQYWLLFIYYR